MSLGYNKEKYVRIVDALKNKWAGNREEAADAIEALMQLTEVISRINDAIWEIAEEFREERDMVLDDIKNSADPCEFCKHKHLPGCEEPCLHCDIEDNESAFEWRGVTDNRFFDSGD